MTLLLPAAIAVFASWLTLCALRRSGRLPVDRPNARSLHRVPVPRAGGIAIWAGLLAGTAWLPQSQPWLVPLLGLAAVSLWDDRRGVAIAWRLAAQFAAAAGWLWTTGLRGPPEMLAALLAIVWMANLYNFMDGSDGLAGTMTVIGFGALAAAAHRAGAAEAVVMAAVVGATVPFLLLNRPPARVMLGDVGAVPLGFLVAVLGIGGWRSGDWPAWFPVLVFLPFVADATVTLLRRALSGAAVWRPHRDHSYQRLVRSGLGHGGALAIYAAQMLGTAASALIALDRAPDSGPAVLAVWVLALLLYYTGIGYHWHRIDKGLNESKC